MLQRCLPAGLLDYLHSNESVPVNEADLLTPRNNLQTAMRQQNSRPLGQLQDQLKSMQISVEAKLETLLQHWNVQQKFTALQRKEDRSREQRPVVLRKRKRMIKATMNWRMLIYQFNCNHSKANLIWNEKTREEFRQAIVSV